MADITNPEAVRFSNEKIRVAADRLCSVYYFAKTVMDEWFANGISSVMPNTSDVVADGSATDGRHSVTGIDANNVVNRCSEIVADFEANSKAKLNTCLSVAVNPTIGLG